VMDNKNQLQLDEKSLLQDKQDSEPDHGSSWPLMTDFNLDGPIDAPSPTVIIQK
jgi:hypothetical protein